MSGRLRFSYSLIVDAISSGVREIAEILSVVRNLGPDVTKCSNFHSLEVTKPTVELLGSSMRIRWRGSAHPSDKE